MNPTLNSQQLDRMAWTIANRGFETIPSSALRELGFEARRAGVNAAVTHTLADNSVPMVVRQRAFGVIAARLTGFWRGLDTAPVAKEPCAA
jgi:hypothetical protein